MQVMREVDGGVETVSLSLPAVITTDLRLNEPRYATLPNIMKAKRKPFDTMEPDDFDVELGSPKVEVVGYSLPSERQAGQIVGSVQELMDETCKESLFVNNFFLVNISFNVLATFLPPLVSLGLCPAQLFLDILTAE